MTTINGWEDIEVISVLKSSIKCRVVLCEIIGSLQKKVVVKEYKVCELKTQQEVDHVWNERRITQLLKGVDGIVDLLGTFKGGGADSGFVCLVFDHVPGKSLADTCLTDEEDLYAVWIQVVRIVESIHKKGIVHRDIKLGNIIVGESDKVTLLDFGMAKQIDTCLKRTYSICGTPYAMAPEQLSAHGYSFPVDLWALGVLLFEMLEGSFKRDAIVFTRGSFELQNLIRGLLRIDWKDDLGEPLIDQSFFKRFGFQDILSHPWVLKHQQVKSEVLCEDPFTDF